MNVKKPPRPLNDLFVKSVKPKDKDKTYADGNGLTLLVTKEGHKRWLMRSRLNGKPLLLSFGVYPTVTLKEAREKRAEVRKLIDQGINPRDLKKAEEEEKIFQDSRTFEKLARRLYARKEGRTTEDYRNTMLRQFELHVFPVVGHKNIAEIKNSELIALLTAVAEKKNAKGKPMTYMAKKLCQWCAEVYDLANVESDGVAIANPCRFIIKYLPKHESEHMQRIKFSELPDFIKALQAYGGHILTKAAIWMMLYTGVRQISIRNAQWSDFDFEKAIWYRKPEKTDKNIHEIPLPKQAITILKDLRYLLDSKNDLVFPSMYSGQLKMSEAAIGQAIERMGFAMTGHGLRGVVSTGLNELGNHPHIVEVQIGHKKSDAIEAAYNDAKHMNARRKMMQDWADYLDSLKNNKSSKLT